MRLPLNRTNSSKAAQQAILLLFFTNLAAAASAILGIDLGQEFIKAALVKPGIPLEIVLTKDTKRKEVSAVGFKPLAKESGDGSYIYPERLYGADAVNLAARFPNDVYPNLKQLLGKHIFDNAILDYSSRYPALNLLPSPLRSTTSFGSSAAPPDAQNDQSFTVEELLAMQLRDIRRNAEAMAGKGSKIKDVVFTVPVFFNAEERQALHLAAEIAGLKVLSMMNDGSAIALNFATSRTFAPDTKEIHVIYDMGAGSTTATVVEIMGKTVKDVGRFKKNITEINVRGTGWDPKLGGDLFNRKIADHLLEEFVNTPKGKAIKEERRATAKEAVSLNGRSAAKIWREASKVRHVLSANSETKASIESLYEDIDFRSEKITRAQFEEWLAEYSDRITSPIHQALTISGVPFEDITSVILHGGAVRTPFVGRLLEELVGEGKISKTVNSDEAAVMGATFRGAGLSNSFRVKEIVVKDINPYVTAIKYKRVGDEKESTETIFPPNFKLGSEKIVPFKQTSDFAILLTHHMPPQPPKNQDRFEFITQYLTKNLTETHKKLNELHGCTPEHIRTEVRIILSERDGLPELTGAWSGCDVEYEDVPEPTKKGKDNKEDKDKSSSSSSSSSSAAAEASESAAPAVKIITKFESIPLELEILKAGFPALTEEIKTSMIKRLDGFDHHDADRVARDTHFNELESFVYKLRELVTDETFISAAPQAILSTLSEKASTISDWLYEAEHSTTAELKAKYAELKELFDPIHKRREEHSRRPDQMGLLSNALEQTKQLVELMNEAITQDAEKLAKAVAEAAAEVESSSSSADAAATAAPADELDGLDDSSSSSTTTTTTTSTAKPLPTPRYTEDEVATLQGLVAEVSAWIDEKTAAQAALALHEDPVVTLKDIESKILHVNQKIMAVISRRAKVEYDEQQERERLEREAKRAKSKSSKEAKKAKKTASEEASKASKASKAESKKAKETGHDEL